jgi:queuosine precursor transporter
MITMQKHTLQKYKSESPVYAKWLTLLSGIYITILLVCPIAANKIVIINGLTTTAAAVFFPISFAFADVIAEVFGYQVTRQLIWVFVITQFIFGIMITTLIHLPSASFAIQKGFYFNQALSQVLRTAIMGSIVLASSSFLNTFILSKWKIALKGRLFGLRCIFSTFVGDIVCSFFSTLFIYAGVVPSTQLPSIFLTNLLSKFLYAVILMAPAIWCVRFLKESEKIDRYDNYTNFNPFKFKIDYQK